MSISHSPGLKFKTETAYKNKIRERDNHICQLCGGPGHDVDHIIPWRISHDNSPSNLRVLCHKCNVSLRKKPQAGNTLPWDEWCQWLDAELAKYPNLSS